MLEPPFPVRQAPSLSFKSAFRNNSLLVSQMTPALARVLFELGSTCRGKTTSKASATLTSQALWTRWRCVRPVR